MARPETAAASIFRSSNPHEKTTRMSDEEAFHELCGYTLTHSGGGFIHQLVVDAYAAQHATAASKAIGVFFSIVGIYLVAERSFTGRQVQLAHIALAKIRSEWPQMILPAQRGSITVHDVLAAPEGEARDAMIHAWARATWDAFSANRAVVGAFLSQRGIIPQA